MGYETFIGVRHLRSTRGTFLSTLTLLAILGVAVGVTALTAVVSVTGGFVESFRERVLGVNPHILIVKNGVSFTEYELVERAVMQLDGVESTTPFIQQEMLVTRAGVRARPGALIRGTDIDDLLADPAMADLLEAGELESLRYAGQFADRNPRNRWDDEAQGEPSAEVEEGSGAELVGVALGSVLAERLQASVGDEITLLSPLRQLSSIGMEATPESTLHARFRVAAIVSSGFFDFDNRLVVVDYRALQDLLGRGDMVQGVEVRVRDVFATEEMMARMREVLTTGRYRTHDWRMINQNLFSSLQLQKLYLSIIMTVLVVVASSVILCVLMMLVVEKRKEIAILRGMGALRRSIVAIFVFEGMVIGGLGTLLGLAGGVVVCLLLQQVNFGLEFEVYRIDELPVSMKAWEFGVAGLGAMLISLLATLYPSWKAAQVSPLDALRYD
jgi:lipoprotein-releasing system permease protein